MCYQCTPIRRAVIVVGDFNAHLPTLQHNNANTQWQLLADLLHCHNLFPVSCSSIATGPKYTYFSGQTTTTVDYILISPELAPSVNSCTTLAHAPLNVSDHLPISISICTPYTNSLHCEPSHSTINWSKASEDGSIEHYSRQVRCAIAPLLNNTLLSINEVDAEIQHVAGILKDAAFDCLPQIKQKKNKKCIADSDLSALCKQSKAAWKRWKNAGRPRSGGLWLEMRESKRAVKEKISACRARKERADIQKRDQLFKNNSNHRFRIFKPKTSCSKLLDENDHQTTDPSAILEVFRSHFSKLASSAIDTENESQPADSNIYDLEAKSLLNDDQILDTSITLEEIEAAVNTLKLGRSKGADGLNSEHLLYGGPTLMLWPMKIFNAIISLEEVPTCFKEGVIIPVYKGREVPTCFKEGVIIPVYKGREVPTCFKEGVIIPVYKGRGKDPLCWPVVTGVLHSSIMGKTLEIVILKRMSPFLDEIRFPDVNQTAYQKGVSCTDAIFSTQEVLLNYIRQGEKPFLCLYDIEKAFDSVEFPILLQHIFSIGINGKSWRIIKAWYQIPTSRVKHENSRLPPFQLAEV